MRKITTYFIITLVIAIAIFDFWIIEDAGKYHSVSATLIRWAHNYPSIPFLLGFTSGHLFWRMKDKDVYEEKK